MLWKSHFAQVGKDSNKANRSRIYKPTIYGAPIRRKGIILFY